MKDLEKITPYQENFSKWYQDVVRQGKLINYGLVKGTVILKGNSYAIWEHVQQQFNKKLKAIGVENVYLPFLIPYKLIQKEKEHVKGFLPELGIVDQVGGIAIEPIVLRPTSEVLFTKFMGDEVDSYNDLPRMYNQWANIIRYEKKTNPFLRTSEFLWQEGHTVHSTPLEARKFTRKMIKLYAKFFANSLAIPTIVGRKTAFEKFPGAISTYTVECMMKNGRALQAATSHYLGQNFSKAFQATFKNNQNELDFLYQTSWGFSTRIIGAIIMTHGDNRGIVIPPKVARHQIDVLALFVKNHPAVVEVAKQIAQELNRKWRVRLDLSNKSFGHKVSDSEIQGVPLRIEVGPRDLANNIVKLVRRDTLHKKDVLIKDVKQEVGQLLKNIQADLLQTAQVRLRSQIVYCDNYEQFKELILKSKFVLVPFAGQEKEEQKIKEETRATSRCIPLEYPLPDRPHDAKCIITGQTTNRFVIFSLAY